MESRLCRVVACLLAIVGLPACGDSNGGGTPGSRIEVSGTVYEVADTGGKAEPLSGALVRGAVDRNKDGKHSADELVTAESADDGSYRLSVPVAPGETVVLSYRSADYAPAFRTVDASAGAAFHLNATLRRMEALECKSQGCAVQSGKLTLTGLPEGAHGSAQVFNPVAEPNAFPGGFNDDRGNLLVSGVFSAIALEDRSGDALETLDQPADLRMQLPQDTWSVVKDVKKGTDRIEVPLYSFDEISGQWVADGEAFLEDGEGNMLPESALASIRDGTFDGMIYSRGAVRHFSYWNVDWPVDTKQCVTAVVLRADGTPAAGATVIVRGVSYTGISTPVTLGADGRFCREVMRSEAAGEDLDEDGKTGQTTTIAVRVVDGSKIYDLGEHPVPAEQAACGGAGCKDLGSLTLDASKELKFASCTVSGTAVDRSGKPLGGASIYVNDETVPTEVRDAICDLDLMACLGYGSSAADGTFSITTYVMEPTISGFVLGGDEGQISRMRWGSRTFSGCPTGPITLRLEEGYDSVTLTVAVSGTQITWEPATYKIGMLEVRPLVPDAALPYKWFIGTDDALPLIAPPVSYGTVPAGAQQYLPYSTTGGTPPPPAPLASGDIVHVTGIGTGPEGYLTIISGQGAVP